MIIVHKGHWYKFVKTSLITYRKFKYIYIVHFQFNLRESSVKEIQNNIVITSSIITYITN